MTEVPFALAVGFAFGWLLQRAGLSRYERIVGVYRFTDLAVMDFLLSALFVGAVCLRVISSLGLGSAVPIPSTFLVGNGLGGLLFGVGMATSGYCPGTVAAGAGEGRLDYLIPGMLGLCVGALSFGMVYPVVFPVLARGAQPGATLPTILDAEPWLVILVLGEVAVLAFAWIDRVRASRRDEPI